MDTFKNWFNSLQDRERHIVSLGGVIVVMLLLYMLIWSPLSNTVSYYKNRVKSQSQLLRYAQHAKALIQRYQSSGISVSTKTDASGLLAVVEQSLSAQTLSQYLKQVQQPAHNQIALTFDNVPFDKLMQWLQTLTTTHDVSVKQLSATRLPMIGAAHVQIILSTHG